MSNFDQPPRYGSYLLTFWEERNQDPDLPPAWRFRLEEAGTGQQRGFASLEALLAELEQEIADKLQE